jgi:hypothetical protein
VHKGRELCGDKAVCNGGCCPDGERCTTCGSCHRGQGLADCEMKHSQGYNGQQKDYNGQQKEYNGQQKEYNGQQKDYNYGEKADTGEQGYAGEWKEQQKGSDSIAIKGNNCNTNHKYPVMCLGQKCCKAGLVCHWNGQCISVHKGRELCGDKAVCNGGCCPDGHRCTTCGSCHKGDGPADCERKYDQGYNGQQTTTGGKGYTGGKQSNAQAPAEYSGPRQGYSDQQTETAEQGYAGVLSEEQAEEVEQPEDQQAEAEEQAEEVHEKQPADDIDEEQSEEQQEMGSGEEVIEDPEPSTEG